MPGTWSSLSIGGTMGITYTIEELIENPGLACVKDKHKEKSEMFCISPSDFELENPGQLKDLYVEHNCSEGGAVICHPLSSHRVVVAMEMAKTKLEVGTKKRPIGCISAENDEGNEKEGSLARKLFKDSKDDGKEEQEKFEEGREGSGASSSRSGEAVDEELLAPARPDEEA